MVLKCLARKERRLPQLVIYYQGTILYLKMFKGALEQ